MDATTEPASRDQTWYEATSVPTRARSHLGFDLDVDCCVIGGGLAGLTAAREVARRGWSVAVLEGSRVGWAASGRNTGFALPGFSEEIDGVIERIGLDHAAELWALSEAGLSYVRRTIAETGMPGVEPVDGWLNISKTDNEREISARVERLRWIGADVEAWPSGRVREVLPSRYYFNAVHFPRAFHIHPLNYALGLAAAAEAAGARIFEETPAVSIDAAGVRKRITTPMARVRAHHVVLAGNVHLGALMPRLSATLMPITTYVIVTEPIGPILNEVIRYRGAVSDTDWADNHYRIVGDRGEERLQWSGRMTVWEANPRLFARGLAASIRRNFPQLGKIGIAHVWHGTLGRTVHSMPQIGEIERGVWVASGFGGHGINTTAMAGELIARGIVEADQTWRLFAPYELVWAGGVLGRAAAQTLYLASRPVAAATEGLARYRESLRKRRETKRAARADASAAKPQIEAAMDPAIEPAAAAPVAADAAETEQVNAAPDSPPDTRLPPEPEPVPESAPERPGAFEGKPARKRRRKRGKFRQTPAKSGQSNPENE